MNSVNGQFLDNPGFGRPGLGRSGLSGSRFGAEVGYYSAEDVQAILAIALNNAAETVSATQLQEMADELSIEPAVLASSVEAWQRERVEENKKRDRRKAFYRQQLIPFLSLNTFLMLLNISLAGTITWAIYPFLGTGVSLFFKPCRKSSSPSSSPALLTGY